MIGILGGTFDPVHRGHLHVATQLLARLQLERLQFMPCAQPVHRDPPHATPEQRRAMIELAIGQHPGLELNPLELERGGPSYSVDSLHAIRREEGTGLALILGSDAFNGFARWKQPREILRLAHLVICHRPGSRPDPALFAEARVDSAAELRARPAGGILLLEIDANDCASSTIRASLAAGEDRSDCLDPGVAAYIKQHQLYEDSGD